MILDRKEKQPAEVKDYPIDYSAWLAEISGGDTIVSATAVAVCLDDPADTALIVDKVVVSSTSIAVWLSAGTANKRYKVTVSVITVGGRKDESEFIIKLKDR